MKNLMVFASKLLHLMVLPPNNVQPSPLPPKKSRFRIFFIHVGGVQGRNNPLQVKIGQTRTWALLGPPGVKLVAQNYSLLCSAAFCVLGGALHPSGRQNYTPSKFFYFDLNLRVLFSNYFRLTPTHIRPIIKDRVVNIHIKVNKIEV